MSSEICSLEVISASRQLAPKDKFYAAYVCFALLGFGLLMPWNSMITAVDYFAALYPGYGIDANIALAYNVPNLAAMAWSVFSRRNCSRQTRLMSGFGVFLLGTVALPLVDAVCLAGSRRGTGGTLAATLAVSALLGAADGVAQTSLFGAAGCLPPRYTQAVCAGTSLSGLGVSLLRVATKASAPGDLRRSAFVYFGIAAFVSATCLLVQAAVVPSLPIVKHYSQRALSAPAQCLEAGKPGGTELPGRPACELPAALSASGNARDSDEQRLLATEDGPEQRSAGGVRLQLLRAIARMKQEAAALVLTYLVTLSIFPGFITDDVKSEALGDWLPVLLITVYNIGDLAGKAGPWLVFFRPRTSLLFSVVRFAFLPVFLVISTAAMHPAIVSLVTLTLGISNGHLTACAMMNAPVGLPQDEAEQAGMLSALFLMLGIALGSAVGFVWQLR